MLHTLDCQKRKLGKNDRSIDFSRAGCRCRRTIRIFDENVFVEFGFLGVRCGRGVQPTAAGVAKGVARLESEAHLVEPLHQLDHVNETRHVQLVHVLARSAGAAARVHLALCLELDVLVLVAQRHHTLDEADLAA